MKPRALPNHGTSRPAADPLPDDVSWRRLPDPADEELATALIIPLGATLGLLAFVLWVLLTPLAPFDVDWKTWLAAATVLLPLHEVVHAAAFPRARERGPLRIECSLEPMAVCIVGDRVLSRGRYVWVLLAPLAVVSLAPILACAALHATSGPVVVLSLFNALASGGDVLAALFVIVQVPNGALLHRRGTAMACERRPATARAAMAESPATEAEERRSRSPLA
jgi:hypothetical protein